MGGIMIIAAIESQMGTLRPSERLVARYILGRPSVVVHMSIADLAESVVVSEPTIMRFCKALGCTGFMEFKLALARDLERRTFQRNRANPAVKGPAGIGQAIFSQTLAALVEAGQSLPLDRLDEVLELCASSRVVTIVHDQSEALAAKTLVDSLLSCRIEAKSQTNTLIQGRLDGRLIIALRSANQMAGFDDLRAQVEAGEGKVASLGFLGRDTSLSICASTKDGEPSTTKDGTLQGDLAYLTLLETLRACIQSRLSRTGAFSETKSDVLQSQREIAYGDARRRDRKTAQAADDRLTPHLYEALKQAQTKETA
jgi:RpiR family transcriptional regulator, carbohydrate utilization regulator